MDIAIPRQCLEPGCPDRAVQGSRCPRHSRGWVGGQSSWRYGPGWSRIRTRVLAEEPRCVCGASATEVDHIVALALGGTHDRRNLRGLCHRCHVEKTASDSRLGKARKAKRVGFSRDTARHSNSAASARNIAG